MGLRNPKYTYSPSSGPKRLVSFGCEEQRREFKFLVDDPVSAGVQWLLKAPMMRFQFRQQVETEFGDKASYDAVARTPPATQAAATAAAAAVSIVDLVRGVSGSGFDAVARVGRWELVGHEFALEEPGVFKVVWSLEAYSDPVWLTSGFTKTRLADADLDPTL